jgi:septal ring factor EnvC (AmiA/AmiB activator)
MLPMQNTSQETDNLRAELDRATQAIKGVRENLALLTTSLNGSTAKLESVIDKAIAQAEKSSDSSAKLARSLNVITCCLVGVGVIQILIYLWHR